MVIHRPCTTYINFICIKCFANSPIMDSLRTIKARENMFIEHLFRRELTSSPTDLDFNVLF